ncbi:MAG TPA: carbohydrate porin [Acetobacteraceae bacterium]|nr:carbohydrate porin [Acetobacteraceae bacterium]
MEAPGSWHETENGPPASCVPGYCSWQRSFWVTRWRNQRRRSRRRFSHRRCCYRSRPHRCSIVADVAGGNKQGTTGTGDAAFRADFDLNTIAGIRNTAIHVTFDDRAGFNASPHAGTLFGLSGENGPFDTIQLPELSWDQSLCHDHLRLLLERINPTALLHLMDFPTTGARRPRLSPNTRLWVVPPYLVFYQYTRDDDTIRVLRFPHGRRHIARRLFKP